MTLDERIKNLEKLTKNVNSTENDYRTNIENKIRDLEIENLKLRMDIESISKALADVINLLEIN